MVNIVKVETGDQAALRIRHVGIRGRDIGDAGAKGVVDAAVDIVF